MKNKYLKCIDEAEKVAWRIDDVLPPGLELSFEKRFLPKALTCEDRLDFLSKEQKLKLNHIRGASYLNLFAYIEQYISSLTIHIASESLGDDKDRLRALLKFSEEEVKHQTLFMRFIDSFKKSFGSNSKFLSNSEDIANVILSNSELAVLILTYHLELITQDHYLHTVRSEKKLDSTFERILKKHWQEESQHAKLDLYEIQRNVESASDSNEIFLTCLEEYFNILDAFCDVFITQVKMDAKSLEESCSFKLTQLEYSKFVRIQHFSYIYNFVFLGLKNKLFKNEMGKLCPESISRIEEKLQMFYLKYNEGLNAA